MPVKVVDAIKGKLPIENMCSDTEWIDSDPKKDE